MVHVVEVTKPSIKVKGPYNVIMILTRGAHVQLPVQIDEVIGAIGCFEWSATIKLESRYKRNMYGNKYPLSVEGQGPTCSTAVDDAFTKLVF